MVPLLGAVIRVVVFTPIILTMYVLYAQPEPILDAVVENGLDPIPLAIAVLSSPQILFVAGIAAFVAVISPYLNLDSTVGGS